MSSWPQLGVAIGLILSIGPMALFNAKFGKDGFTVSNWYAQRWNLNYASISLCREIPNQTSSWRLGTQRDGLS